MTLAFAMNGVQVISGSVTLPYRGLWSADVLLSSDTNTPVTPGAVTLTIGNLSLVGTVYRESNFAASRSARILAGYSGWGNPITPRAYRNPAGNRLSMVLQDLATEAGEKLTLATDATLSTLFCREGSTPSNPVPASRILNQLSGSLWWVDPTGMTQVGPRPSNPITSPFTIVVWSGAHGSFEVATEDLASWVPGNTFVNDTVTTMQTISSVTIEASNEGTMRLKVLSIGQGAGV